MRSQIKKIAAAIFFISPAITGLTLVDSIQLQTGGFLDALATASK